jgi:hypothetical protein
MDQAQYEIPEEFRALGEFREVYATTLGAIALSVFRSLIPIALGTGLFAIAHYWIVNQNWKYYLAVGIGVFLALQGIRLLIRTLLRRNQKVMIFEKGIAVYRHGQVATYPWDRVEQVEATIAKAQGAPTSFMSFSFQGRTEEGETRSYTFHPAGDPIPNLQRLWKVIDEGAGRGRAAAVIEALKKGEEVTFQRTIWGTIVSTQIGISLFGIRAKPRYGEQRFLDWSRVEKISLVDQPTAPQEEGYTTGGIAHLEVIPLYGREPWLSELTAEIPGYQALLEATEFARLRFRETFDELQRERLPDALAVIEKGQVFRLGKFGIGQNGFEHDGETISWQDLGYLLLDKDHWAAPNLNNRTFPYDSLPLADRWLLQRLALAVKYGDDDEDEEEEDEDEGPPEEESKVDSEG